MKKQPVVSYSENRQQSAWDFAQDHALACRPFEQLTDELTLHFGEHRVELRDLEKGSAVHVDFIGGVLAHRKKYGGGRGQAIARAIGLKPGAAPPRVLDATAGLGKDAFVMACLGCPLTLVERSPLVAELVADAIRRAADDKEFQHLLQTGFNLVNADAIEYLKNMDEPQRPDVVYLDPMYPQRKKSALVKKNMQLLQQLLGQDEDTGQLLQEALRHARKRVVVKRPKGADPIAGFKPTTCVESKKTRYDVYVTKLFV